MSPIAPEQHLADLVTTDPARTRVLERFGLDYCCGGSRTLNQACTEAGVDTTEVIDALEQLASTPVPDWASMNPTELCRHIVDTHHAYLWEEMPQLAALVDKVADVHGGRHPELAGIRSTYRELIAELAPHLRKEEEVLFPAIAALAAKDGAAGLPFPTIAMPIRMMMIEHDQAGELLASLREQTGGYQTPADGCTSYAAMMGRLEQLEGDTHLHIHKENNLLFPAVLTVEKATRAGR